MGDELVYELASTTELDEKPFIHKDWVNCSDSQSGSYGSSQITISTEQLSNSGQFIDYSQAYLSVPIYLTTSVVKNGAQVDMNTVANEFIVGLKNGYWNIFHSVQIQYNNGDLIQPVPFKNMYTSYKVHSSFSQDDLVTLGPTIGYYPDSSDSWKFNGSIDGDGNVSGALGVGGVGFCNNENHEAPFSGMLGYGENQKNQGNKGFINRQKAQFLSKNGFSGQSFQATGGIITNDAKLKVCNQNYTYLTTLNGSTARTLQVAVITATIRLKEIADFFGQLPLLKGATIKMYINTNQCQFTVHKKASSSQFNASIDMKNYDLNINGGQTNPMMIASTQAFGLQTGGYVTLPAGNLLANVPPIATVYPLNADGSITVPALSLDGTHPAADVTIMPNASGAIVFTTGTGQLGVATSAVRTIYPTRYSSPISASALCALPVDSAYDYDITCGLSIGAVTNQLHVANNIKSALPVRLYAPVYTMSPEREREYLSQGEKKISFTDVVYYKISKIAPGSPIDKTISNGVAGMQKVICIPVVSDTQNGLNLMGSPFSTEPATTSALPSCLTGINCKVSGLQILAQSITYGFEAFLHEQYGSESVNGGLTTGFNSGLISKRDWENNYQYYVFDVSRRSAEEEMVSKGLEVIGINNSLCEIDVHVFIEFKREIVIDLATGARVA